MKLMKNRKYFSLDWDKMRIIVFNMKKKSYKIVKPKTSTINKLIISLKMSDYSFR